ncbi:PTS sugar transporter subunit IIC [Erysipelothrix sp. HDW6A]|uniref:PTS sugar transporter subunit IIC n=1 Tax=Erysipelothrix sp. HDW6A TaxID=2714928 RepID=UPI001409AAC7|nr:PTS transporter subunit EIIC [Erysipelothrix sp. HDW6A]QIK58173.1 PTS sugar transporter subunit IIC [Erysipelothrix sp. HDW6A]
MPFPDVLKNGLNLMALMTASVISLYVVASVSGALAKIKEQDTVSTIILSILMFLLVTPFTKDDKGVLALSTGYLGNKGMFLAIIVGLLAPQIYYFFLQGKLFKIKFPDSVPETIKQMFNSIIPYLVTVLIFVGINLSFSQTSFGNIHDLVYSLLQAPLANLGNSIWSVYALVLLAELFWFFGIHGSMVTNVFLTALFSTQATANLEALASGQPIPYIISTSFIGAFKGPRALALAIVLLFFCKSRHFKSVGKLSIIPSFFSISEPMKFGIPMVMNPYLLIPMSLAPVVSIAIAYGATLIGFMNPVSANVVQIIPPVISGVMAAGWQGAVVQIIQLVAVIALYLPFVKRIDTIEYNKELESNHV